MESNFDIPDLDTPFSDHLRLAAHPEDGRRAPLGGGLAVCACSPDDQPMRAR